MKATAKSMLIDDVMRKCHCITDGTVESSNVKKRGGYSSFIRIWLVRFITTSMVAIRIIYVATLKKDILRQASLVCP